MFMPALRLKYDGSFLEVVGSSQAGVAFGFVFKETIGASCFQTLRPNISQNYGQIHVSYGLNS